MAYSATKSMSNTTSSAFKQLASSKPHSVPSIAVGGINVGGNVPGNITVGNENIVGDHNVVFQVHTDKGGVVNLTQAAPAVQPRSIQGRPLRLPRGFIGRASYLDQIGGHIKSNQAVLVYGHDGIGKTSLLAQASNSDAALSKRDGLVFVEGIDDDGILLSKSDIIQSLFDALFESNPILKVTSPTARPYLSNTQPLVILDHLNIPMSDLRNLPDLFPEGALLIASEEPTIDNRFLPIHLSPLEREESIQLFVDNSGIVLDGTTRGLIHQICDLLGDVPLAITRTANAIRQNGLTLKTVAENLAVLQPPSQDKTQAAIERSFGLIYSALNKQERYMLAITAAAPGISVDREWLESLTDGKKTSQALESLGMLVANSPRLRLPDGLRQVLETGRRDLPALRELLLHHLLNELKSRSLDFKFVRDELGNILGLLQWASNERRWSDVIALGKAVDPYLTLRGLWDAWETVLKRVLEAGENLKNLAVRGWALHQLGTREIGVGSRDQAISWLRGALLIRLSQGDVAGAAYTLHNLRIILPQKTEKTDETDTNKTDRQFDSDTQIYDPWDGSKYWDKIWKIILDNLWMIGTLLAVAVIAVVVSQPSLKLSIQANPTTYSPVGQLIEYRYRVDNSGLTRLENIDVFREDGVQVICPDLDTIGNGDFFFDWNESLTCISFYEITDADVKNGSVTHQATAIAGKDGPSSSDSITIQRDDRYIKLDIQIDPAEYRSTGETITVFYLVRNVGTARLSGQVKVQGEKLQGNCPNTQQAGDGILEPNESLACTASFRITEEDVETGLWTDTASASVGDYRSDPELVTIYWVLPSELTLKKLAQPMTYQQVDEKIQYTYEVANQGKVALEGPVIIEDNKVQPTCSEQDAVLRPGEIVTCSAIYTITEADIENGSVTNTAIASTKETQSEPKSVTIYRVPPSILTLKKSAVPTTYQQIGENIQYTYVVANPNRDPVKGPVTIADDKVQPTCSEQDEWLNPGEQLTCSATYTIIEADLINRSVTNTAVAIAGDLLSEEQSTTIYFEPPLPLLSKSAYPVHYYEIGQVIDYTYTVINPGPLHLSGLVTIKDDKIQTPCTEVVRQGDSLDPGASFTCTVKYTITAEDMQNESVTNTAWAIVDNVISEPRSVTIYRGVVDPPILRLRKSAESEFFQEAGEKIRYRYSIANAGPVPLKGPVFVEDDRVAPNCPNLSGIGDLDNVLDPGESLTCIATYTITDADFQTGSVTNTATASAGGVSSNPSSVTIYARAISLEKSADHEPYREVGETINYAYDVIGRSKLPLKGPVIVTDDKVKVDCPDLRTIGDLNGFLDWNETITCTGSYFITQVDLDHLSLTNTAVASADGVSSEPFSLTIPGWPLPQLSLASSAAPTTYDTVGQEITYEYEITNNGNVTLYPAFMITDDHVEDSKPFECETDNQPLAPQEKVNCTAPAPYGITQADFVPKFVTNTATASVIYLERPITSPPVETTITCLYPQEWFAYIVRDGNSLSNISSWYGYASNEALQKANCMGSLSDINPGQTLYVPRSPFAEITGYVQDTRGQRLDGVTVRLRNENGIVVREVETDSNGDYAFLELTPGAYFVFQVQISLSPGDSIPKDFTIVPLTQ